MIDVHYAGLTSQGVQHREIIQKVTHPDNNPILQSLIRSLSGVFIRSSSGDVVDWLCVRLRNTIGHNGLLKHNHLLLQNVVIIVTGYYPLWDQVKFIDQDPHWCTCRLKF